MKLKAIDQIQVTAVQSTPLVPDQEFEIDDAFGDVLVKRNPRSFEVMEQSSKPASAAPAEKAIIGGAPKNKADPAPVNKAEAAPSNKETKK